ncbi:MAG: arsenite S-adenosylmethyltransferase [Methanobacterium sp. PtaU1.Bin242]|nr:MAG: arsenite S-adenosylmethyltransferase [Methanobacterium sp. PtaU1.Bin242]
MSDKKHGHVHHSRSTRDILSAEKVLSTAGLKSGDNFLDAGCGDGFISITASSIVGDNGKVHAVDVYPESIEKVKEEISKKGIENMEAIVVDLTSKIPVDDDSIDLCVMANVLHGFVENDEVREVMAEISRVIKPDGVFAVVEFKKIEGPPGPPFKVRVNPQDVEDIVSRYGFEVAETAGVGKYHYLVKSFKKT